jgi:hypothetical protein
MCVEIHHMLACDHYNDEYRNPVETIECYHMTLSQAEQAYSDRVNGPGPHPVLEERHEFDHTAICSECREKEDRHMRRGEPLKYPNARETV